MSIKKKGPLYHQDPLLSHPKSHRRESPSPSILLHPKLLILRYAARPFDGIQDSPIFCQNELSGHTRMNTPKSWLMCLSLAVGL
jgi:hypothetical protein